MKIRNLEHDEKYHDEISSKLISMLIENINIDNLDKIDLNEDLDEDRKEWIRKYQEYHKTKK
jgi:hypothetical protein